MKNLIIHEEMRCLHCNGEKKAFTEKWQRIFDIFTDNNHHGIPTQMRNFDKQGVKSVLETTIKLINDAEDIPMIVCSACDGKGFVLLTRPLTTELLQEILGIEKAEK